MVSDQHLGYENADKDAFNQFLDHLKDDPEVTDLVLLGDVVDMWRRDVSGIFLENYDIIEKILGLPSTIKIHCVAGNHDYHALALEKHKYPLKFTKDLTLPSDGITYRFKHGWEFDLAQQEPIMELLCHNMSDEIGQMRTGFWDLLTGSFGKNALNSLQDLFKFHKSRAGYLKHLQTPPEKRLKPYLKDVEKKACQSVKRREVLIFGHTHRPFINTTETVANSGSWVKDAEPHNTYVELSGGKPRLFVFGGQEITGRVQC